MRVLMYHGVDDIASDRDPHGMFVRPDVFRQQLEHLLETGHTPIDEATYLGALRGGPLPAKPVLVTFDDGYVSVAEHATPVLVELDVPSVLYVPVGLIGRRSEWLDEAHRHAIMTVDELLDLDLGRMALGLHGFDHSDLVGRSEAELRRNTVDSRAELSRLTQQPIRTFAYPYGGHDAAARRATEGAGFEAAFAVHDGSGDFAITRVDVNATDTMRTFAIKLNRWYPHLRRAAGATPRLRRMAHDLLGRQSRPSTLETEETTWQETH
ncbi:polysaccharide deacetylase family protein [Nocardioides ultimimeridianus]